MTTASTSVHEWIRCWEGSLLIDGERVPTAAPLPVHDPATGQLLGNAGSAAPSDVEGSVRSATRAFAAWRATPPAERGAILMATAERIRARRQELAELTTLECGKPLSESLADVDGAAHQFQYFGGLSDKVGGRELPHADRYCSFTRREPLGVTAHITPWNFPLSIPARSLAAAMAMGNTAVVKPAEQTPFSALLLADLAMQAGIPPGVLNVVPGIGPAVGADLVNDDAVRAIAFTGSVPVGRKVGEAAGRRIVRASLELGGKAPNIVFADADLDEALDGAVFAITRNAGQSCLAGSRLLVDQAVYDDFIDRLLDRLSRLELGHGLHDPDMGPLISGAQFERVARYVELGSTEGELVLGGARAQLSDELAGGYYFLPTVFTDISPDSRIAQEEIFGPVVCVFPFVGEAQALEIANDVSFGLAAGLWTSNLSRALRMTQRLEAGSVFVNEYPILPYHAPHGGYKDSGIGREKGLDAVESYTQIKHMSIRIGE